MSEFKGKVTAVLAEKSGTTKSGDTWYSQNFVVTEEKDQYPQSAVFNVFNRKIPMPNVGDVVNVAYNLSAKEYNGNYYQELRAWKVDVVGVKPIATSIPAQGTENDDLPF
jgi:type 1 fimbria pilin